MKEGDIMGKFVKIIITVLFILIVNTVFSLVLYTYGHDVPPKYFIKDGKIQGLCNDIISELNKELKSSNIEIRYKSNTLFTPNEVLEKLERNEIQILVGIGYFQEKEDNLEYVKFPLYSIRETFTIRKGMEDKINTLQNVRIGVIGGTLPSRKVSSIFKKSEIKTFKNPQEAISALDKGTIDAIFWATLPHGYYISLYPDKYNNIELISEKIYHYVVVSKNLSKVVTDKIYKAIKVVNEKGVIENLIKKYKLDGLALPGNNVEILLVDWKPYEWYDEKEGKWKGFDVDTVSSVFKRLGFQAIFRTLPWERCLGAMKVYAYDGIMSVMVSDERKEFLLYPDEPLSTGVDVLFRMKNRNIPLDSIENIPKTIICGYSSGYGYGSWFWNAPFTKEPVIDDVTGFTLLRNGRLDLFVCNLIVGKSIAKDLGMEKDVVYSKNFGEKMIYYLAFSKNFHGSFLQALFAQELKNFKKTQEYREILKRYGLEYNDLW